MQKIVKKFFNKLLDTDKAEHLVAPDNFISGQNIRIGTTDKGGMGYIENILKNSEVAHTLPVTGTNTTIGLTQDDEEGWIIKFNYNSAGNHGIYLYDLDTTNWYTVLLDEDVTGGLGFEKNELIHSARIENGHVYWVNSTINEPRRIDIRAGVNYYHSSPLIFTDVDAYTSPLSQSVISWVRRPPGLPPTATKATDSPGVNNFTGSEAFWFCYRYIYRGYEVSTLSALSQLINYNMADDTYNYVAIEIPNAEPIDQDVLQVDLVAKHASSGGYFVIKSWNKNIPADLAAIQAHNVLSPGNPLSFDYANDFIGIALDSAYSVKPYDSLPIYAETMEIAKNRAFMANHTIGYDTPTETSLTASVQTEQYSGTVTGTWLIATHSGGTDYYLNLGALGFFNTPDTPPMASVSYFTLSFISLGWGDFSAYVLAQYPTLSSLVYTGNSSTITNAPSLPSIIGSEAFKSGSNYQLSINFFDNAGRKCGILTNNDLKINLPEREYNQGDYATEINWLLLNANSDDEIPDWAYYYSINITKCLTTRYFLQSRVKNLTYVTKDADGVYVYGTTGYDVTLNGIGIDITRLNGYGMGYTFEERGDLVKLYKGTDVYNLSVVAQDGNWLVCELVDIGTIGDLTIPYISALFEIYIPYKPSTSEPHYEVGEIYEITNPTEASRTYSTLSGTIYGDITLLSRNDGFFDYLTENMSPNDTYYTRWNTDSGRPNFTDDIGQVEKTNEIVYSDTLIPGSKTNGLSTFEALNTKDVPLECGDISKLQMADKIAEQGTIMLALCTQETVSLYLGESQLLSTTGNAFLAQSSGVIGTVNVLKGSLGTMNPESVIEFKGRVFFYSLIKGCFAAYSNNGLFPISDYGLKRVAHLFSQKYASLSVANIEALGSRPFVFAGVDPYHEEVFFSIPSTESTPPKEYLSDYTSPDLPIIYPYDIYDGVGKVLVYKINADSWGAPHTYETEYFVTIRDFIFSAKDGALYQHNFWDGSPADVYNYWYGVASTSAIGFIVNEEANVIKKYLTLSIEGDGTEPTWIHHRTEYPNVQSSDCEEFTVREGVVYEKYGILRDRLSPNVTGTYDQKLFSGDVMRGQWLKVFVKYDTHNLLQIRFFNIAFVESIGNKT